MDRTAPVSALLGTRLETDVGAESLALHCGRPVWRRPPPEPHSGPPSAALRSPRPIPGQETLPERGTGAHSPKPGNYSGPE
ncbi:hypothetical protein SKAU_G00277780 [Synaphobranchus kaupii]|uniref:Uncharacterized protein n=1 Tax=Synaphobranchus kaupii TaxID=118154 RepID=A0A9Q1EWJ1_SYNKA|nr:hypothetical protein SKAU_G00277780 [Synaphobranchus kaupii]